jgi:hypothetical protein
MSDIKLVKQVPDISQITDNAFNPETGTLIRTRLQNVINGIDTQALAFAYRMKMLDGDEMDETGSQVPADGGGLREFYQVPPFGFQPGPYALPHGTGLPRHEDEEIPV